MPLRLEREFQRKLQLSHWHRGSRLVDGAKRTGAGRWDAVGTADIPSALRHIRIWIAEIRIVQQIECFNPKLDTRGADVKTLDCRKIDDKDARAGERAAPEVAKRSKGVHLKRRHIEPRARAALTAWQLRAYSGHRVGTVVAMRRA